MANALEQIRQQYPQYANRSDRELADALYAKFYAGKIEKPAYYAKLGLTAEDRESWSPMQSANNVVNQAGTGIADTVFGLLGLPGTLSEYGAKSGIARDYQERLAKMQGRTLPPDDGIDHNPFPSGSELSKLFQSATGKAAKGAESIGIPAELAALLRYQPAPTETRGDKFLHAAGSGAAAVLFPGNAVANLTGGVIGSELSEGAGQLTEGTKYEPAARLLGGLLGGAAGVGGASRIGASSIESILSRATMGATPDDWTRAAALKAQAQAQGMTLTAAEALAQVQGGNRSLMGLQRYAEQAPDSAPRMAELMRARPGENAAATERGLGSIAQRPDAPFEIGPTVQAAARKSIEDTRREINRLTDDAYRWGTDAMIPPAEFAATAESPVFKHYLERVRNDPLLGSPLQDLPDNSVAVVNAVKKEMGEAAENYSAYGTGQASPERAMRLGEVQRPMVDAARRASPLYGEALDEQAALRQSRLDPMKRGATGQVADTSDWEQQARVFLSDAPGAEKEVAQAVRNILKADPRNGETSVAALVRMKLEDSWNKAAANVKGNAEEFRGASFASSLSKNPQQLRSLEAAITAMPDGATKWAGFRRLLDVFEAQGQRMPAGSPTEFNRMLTGGLEKNLLGSVKSLGRDVMAGWNLRRKSAELARILVDPEGVGLLHQLAQEGPRSARAAQLVQTYFQGATTGKSESGIPEPIIDILRARGSPAVPATR